MTDNQLAVLLSTLSRQLNLEIGMIEEKLREKYSMDESMAIVSSLRGMATAMYNDTYVLSRS